MSQIFPFKAFRYNYSNSKIANAVCPPYDVIDDSLEKKLRKIPTNALRIELPSGSQDSKYERAKRTWEKWRKMNVVQQDSEPAFYIYEQNFFIEGKHLSRKGFFCALQIEKPGKGSVLRHELTLSKPKEDRLRLLRSLQVNTSPIFGLFQDPQKNVGKILDRISKQNPLNAFKDSSQIIHKLWRCSDREDIKIVQNTLKKSVVVIADGHHRYETAWDYYSEKRKNDGSSLVLFYLCSMQSSGIVILPTHRILKSKNSLDRIEKKLQSLKNLFKWASLPQIRPLVPIQLGSNFLLITNGRKALKITPQSFRMLRKMVSDKSEDLLRLPLVQIHSILLPELKKEDFIYTHDDKDAIQLAMKNRTLAFLVPPVSVQKLYGIVSRGELMPQKSTYFYPKVTTGIVFRSLV